MATYEFECKDCKTKFAINSSFASMVGCEVTCPCCRSENIKKFYGNIGIIFKGKGFYNTDNKKEENNGN